MCVSELATYLLRPLAYLWVGIATLGCGGDFFGDRQEPETREQRIARQLKELEERLNAIRAKYENDHAALKADVEAAVQSIRENEKNSTAVLSDVRALRGRVDEMSQNIQQYIIDLKAIQSEGGKP